jgi:hypothetical protein
MAEHARVSDDGSLKAITFTWNGFDFKVWIDPQSARIVKYSLTDGTRTVDGTYSAIDAAPVIETPVK